ncbi:MAG: P-loop NTPase [Candidatus Micrarchaeales archaeon]|nr:P-loop NTPase [Candidatus Micrarchaeales archaeon]
MRDKNYVIRVSSQKGGVGKTTIAVNLACALSDMGYKTLLIDTDVSNPSVGFHLGLEEVNIGFTEFLTGKVSANRAILKYSTTGLHALPGTIHGVIPPEFKDEIFVHLKDKVDKLNYDFVVLDTAPGEIERAVIKGMDTFVDHAIIVTTPELSSVTAGMRLAAMYDKHGIDNDIVVNRLRNKSYEVQIDEIEESYGKKELAVFPEDDSVPESIAMHIPVVIYNRQARFSKIAAKLAATYKHKGAVQPSEKQTQKRPAKASFWHSLRLAFRRVFLGR